jgi:diguanylate cyclase (GGDEF)-like protein
MPQSMQTAGQIVARTPLTMTALIDHRIEPHEEAWFARCRADYLRATPVVLFEIFRVAMVLLLVQPWRHWEFLFWAIAGWIVMAWWQRQARLTEATVGYDDRFALRQRTWVACVRCSWSSAMLFWGLLIAPADNVTAFTAMGVMMVFVDGITVLTLPRIAVLTSICAANAIAAGTCLRFGVAAAPLVVCLFALNAFMHWALFNLYYMFATRRIRTRRLRESNETIRLLLNQYDDEGSDWLYETDASGRIVNPSPRFGSACERNPDELARLPLLDLFNEGQGRRQLEEALRHHQPFRNIDVPLTVSGEECWWSISGRPVDDGDGRPAWRGFIADITVAKLAEARVAFMAHYDVLTQLPNRTLFTATLERALTRRADEEIVALLYLDLDHFKAINDGHGHAAGDAVLKEVAQRLERAVRPQDSVSRLGGDEFVALLPGLATRDDALTIAEQIHAAIVEPIDLDGKLMPVGGSIGVAFCPGDASGTEDLLRAADLAMYDAKSRGRRGVSVFDAEMQDQMLARRELELDMRAAVARGELELHYQPLLDVHTSAILAYEALLRWNHPRRGAISPELFVPIAEETGSIVEIGEWVLRTALSEAAGWPEEIAVAVNLSPAQIRDGKFLPVVVNALAATGVAPHRLELEITESLLMQDSDEVLQLLHALRGLGVRIALDDFGTGYSSLNYLRSFPFDKIKIDRCFVSELSEREDCQAIVRSVLALAKDLKMATTAEGVEDHAQLEALRLSGCTQVQGFLFSQALPASALPHRRQARGAPGEAVPLDQKRAAPETKPRLKRGRRAA